MIFNLETFLYFLGLSGQMNKQKKYIKMHENETLINY